jgi:hypothetical protein
VFLYGIRRKVFTPRYTLADVYGLKTYKLCGKIHEHFNVALEFANAAQNFAQCIFGFLELRGYADGLRGYKLAMKRTII